MNQRVGNGQRLERRRRSIEKALEKKGDRLSEKERARADRRLARLDKYVRTELFTSQGD